MILQVGFIGDTSFLIVYQMRLLDREGDAYWLKCTYYLHEGVGFMGRGMLFNIMKKINVGTVAIHDVNDYNIKMFIASLSTAEQAKVRVCGSPADVSHYYSRLLSLSA